MYKLVFFVPVESAEKVKKSIFKTGAGQLGNYSHCCFETEGIGQFLPNDNANPAIGKQGQLEKVRELRIELLCSDDNVRAAVEALKNAHPYEEPAYEVYQLINL